MLEFKNLSYKIGDKTILKNINVELEPGITCILGPNGSGKSTLIKVLNTSHEGEIYYNQQLVKTTRDLPISILNQFSHIPDHLTGIQFLTICILGPKPLFARITSDEQQRINQAIEMCECQAICQQLVGNLSGGERQRLLICSTLLTNPQVLILDEPTTFLDIKYQHLVLDILKRLNQKYKLTIILIVHDINLALFASNILLLKNGEIIYHGASANLDACTLSTCFEVPFKKHHNHFIVKRKELTK